MKVRLTIPSFPGPTMNREYHRLNTLGRKENPKEKAGIFSILFYRWVGGIVAIGNKRPIEIDDLFPLLSEDKTETSAEKLERTWNEEEYAKDVGVTDRRGYRLFRALIRMFPWTYYVFVASTTLLAGVCNVLQCVFLSFFVSAVCEVFLLWPLADVRLCCWHLS